MIVPPSELPNLSEVVNGNSTEKKELKKDVKSRRNSENGVSSKVSTCVEKYFETC